MFKDKKNIIILLFIIIIILAIYGIIFLIHGENSNSTETFEVKKNDWSNLTSTELIDKFQSDGYEISVNLYSSTTAYITLENKNEGIYIQRVQNTLIGGMLSFKNRNINDELADLIDISRNNTDEEKQQYKYFEKWSSQYNVSKTQLTAMLDYYLQYQNN